jgi:hypothetical protein
LISSDFVIRVLIAKPPPPAFVVPAIYAARLKIDASLMVSYPKSKSN